MSHGETFGFERCYEEEPGGPSIFQTFALPQLACASGFVSLGSNSGVAAGRLGGRGLRGSLRLRGLSNVSQ